jgi:hypothetical protein
MFKLIKLCVYMLLGYAIYEMYQGMVAGSQSSSGGSAGGSMGGSAGGGRRSGRARDSRGQFTGAGGGQRTETQDASGMSASHTVGRGVVS